MINMHLKQLFIAENVSILTEIYVFCCAVEEEIYNINCEEDKKHGTQVLNMNEIEVV